MSVTTTDNPMTTQVQQTLHDYQIRLTGDNQLPLSSPNQHPSPSTSNPDNWPTNYRNVPNYRPINRHLDWSERSGSTNPIERAFIFTMLHGVWLNASISQAWRHTGGRINGNIFRYKIGGEW